MQALISNTCTGKRRLIMMLVDRHSRSSNSFLLSKETSNSKWSIVSNWEKRPCKNTCRSVRMWTPLLIRWSRRTTKWSVLTKWSKSRASKIWSSPSTRRKPSFRGRRSLKNMKRNWSASLLPNNRIVLTIFRPWKLLLRLRERLFSTSLPRRRLIDVQRRSMLRILETTSRSRKWKRDSELKSEKLLPRK